MFASILLYAGARCGTGPATRPPWSDVVALIGDRRRTVYLNTIGTHVSIDHDAFEIRRPEQPLIRVPVLQVESFVCFGNVEFSTSALSRCAESTIDVSWLTRGGRFRFGLRSPISGNVLLRVEQHRAAVDPQAALVIARTFVAAKLLNSRIVLLDAAKDRASEARALRTVGDELASAAEQTKAASSMDELRGIEGFGAKRYFAALGRVFKGSDFRLEGRERRPPTDPVNALLSFGYSLLTARCVSALEHVGFDPQVGFLHSLRPGRPSLALDLMEELRAPIVDRVVLTVVNRRQLSHKSFVHLPTGAVQMTDDARMAFLSLFDAHLNGEVEHRALEQTIERRKLPLVQARLLSRHLRGDLQHYLPFRTYGR